MNLAIVAAMASAIGSAPGQAQETGGQYLTGNALYRHCTVTPDQPTYYASDARCSAYIIGSYDAIVTAEDLFTELGNLERPFRFVCLPTSVEAGQLRDIVVAYLRDRPADRNQAASLIVLSAIMDAYDCP